APILCRCRSKTDLEPTITIFNDTAPGLNGRLIAFEHFTSHKTRNHSLICVSFFVACMSRVSARKLLSDRSDAGRPALSLHFENSHDDHHRVISLHNIEPSWTM